MIVLIDAVLESVDRLAIRFDIFKFLRIAFQYLTQCLLLLLTVLIVQFEHRFFIKITDSRLQLLFGSLVERVILLLALRHHCEFGLILRSNAWRYCLPISPPLSL